MKRLRIKVSGRVQGVWFRKYTSIKAIELGLTGWVRNEPDGSVLTEAQGSEDQLTRFVEWCHSGSPHSTVEKVESEETPTIQEEEFRIAR